MASIRIKLDYDINGQTTEHEENDIFTLPCDIHKYYIFGEILTGELEKEFYELVEKHISKTLSGAKIKITKIHRIDSTENIVNNN